MSPVYDLDPPAPAVPYFDLAYARRLRPLSDVDRFPDAEIEEARAEAEETLERACRVAFVPRTATERLDGVGRDVLLLPHPRVQRVTALSIDGETIADTTGLVVYPDGRLHWPGGWGRGRQSIEVSYVHGFEQVPRDVKRAARLAVKVLLVGSGVDERATEVRTEGGILRLADDGTFGIPAIDSVVGRYRYPVVA